MVKILLALGHLLCLVVTTASASAASRSAASHYAKAHNYTMRLPMRRRQPLGALGRTSAGNVLQQLAPVESIMPDPLTSTTSSSAAPTPTVVKSNLTPFFKEMAYGIKIWIGDPPQEVILDFDTGSSQTWVSPQCGSLTWSPNYEKLCRNLGSYLPEQSNSVIDINSTYPPEYISYGSGEVYLRYFKDKISFTDIDTVEELEDMMVLDTPVQFGLAKWSSGMMAGIFGAGYGIGYNQNYSGVIDAMHSQGLIRDRDFSLAVGSVDENSGEVIFGGIDMAKFKGPLHGVKMSKQFDKEFDEYYRYWVNVTYIGVTQPGSCTSIPVTEPSFDYQFLPDMGTTMTYMPYDAYTQLLRFFPDAVENYTYGTIVDCGHLNAPGTIDFGFVDSDYKDFTIRVPYSDFIFQLEPGVFGDNNETLCILGAIPSFDEFYILGDTFMRSTYAMFRQEKHKIYFGQYQNCGTNVISSHGIDGFTGDCGEDEQRGETPDDSGDFTVWVSSSSSAAAPSTPTSSRSHKCTSFSTGSYTPLSTTTSSETTDFGSLSGSWTHTPTDVPPPSITPISTSETDAETWTESETELTLSIPDVTFTGPESRVTGSVTARLTSGGDSSPSQTVVSAGDASTLMTMVAGRRG